MNLQGEWWCHSSDPATLFCSVIFSLTSSQRIKKNYISTEQLQLFDEILHKEKLENLDSSNQVSQNVYCFKGHQQKHYKTNLCSCRPVWPLWHHGPPTVIQPRGERVGGMYQAKIGYNKSIWSWGQDIHWYSDVFNSHWHFYIYFSSTVSSTLYATGISLQNK